MRKITSTLVLMTSLLLGACVQNQEMYNWGAYDTALLAYYKDVSKVDAFETELLALIEQTGTSEKPLPPGIYAEYGYLQMKKGDSVMAAKFFELEKQHWPESKLLMDTMIHASGVQPKIISDAKGQTNVQ